MKENILLSHSPFPRSIARQPLRVSQRKIHRLKAVNCTFQTVYHTLRSDRWSFRGKVGLLLPHIHTLCLSLPFNVLENRLFTLRHIYTTYTMSLHGYGTLSRRTKRKLSSFLSI